jgi:hypothetical protein
MLEEERQALLQKINASTEEARQMTRDEATKRLHSEGFCDERGRLASAYGGKITNSR